MKFSSLIFVAIFGLMGSVAFANEPCPTAVPDAPKLDNPTEKCKPELGETAPVLFVFPEDIKKKEADKPSESSESHADPKPLDVAPETPELAEKKSP